MLCLASRQSLLIFAFGAHAFVAALIPQLVQWSSKSYGPDGPWQAVTITIGTPPQTVDLLPGGSWMTNVLAPSVCANGGACSVAQAAGFYDPDSSSTAFSIGQTGFVNNSAMSSTTGAIPTLTGSAYWWFDTMTIQTTDGVGGDENRRSIFNFDLLVITAANEILPDGTTYPAQIGKLALGASNFYQTWLHFPPSPNWNGTILPSSLFGAGITPSISYGMHIGSATLGIPGSLNIGGYDQSRALQPVSGQPYTIDHLPIDLLDIGIGVAEGGSPFNFSSQTGLLGASNSSIGVSVPVLVEATVPYLYLPQSTCDAITKHLPVTFEADYGLYFWNTADPNYKVIVSSPAFLAFTFRANGSTSQNMTINVPFSLLNLTLSAPIRKTPTQYLPLRPSLGPSGSYALGRAFLQAAFVGVNWQTATGVGSGVWFLAQAPGPNTPSDNPPTSINPTDNSIVGSTSSWKDTWKGAWTVLNSTNPPEDGSNQSKKTGGLSHGAIAGIVVGTIAGLSLCGLAAWCLHQRRTHSPKPSSDETRERWRESAFAGSGVPSSKQSYPSSGFAPRELDTGQVSPRPVEMAA